MSPANAQLLFLVLLLLVYLVLVVRPQRNRLRAVKQVQATLAPGRRVMTAAGLIATVAAVDGEEVVLEVAPGVRERWATGAVVRYLDDAPGAAAS